MSWIWQKKSWPNFKWDTEALLAKCTTISYSLGNLRGKLENVQIKDNSFLEVEALVSETLATSAIEGELLERDSVRSSIARKLGIEKHGLKKIDRRADGLIEMLQDAVQNYDQKLTLKRLCGWQTALFPTGYSGIHQIHVGKLRGEEPMRVVSGQMSDRPKVHFEAPPRNCLEAELKTFFSWFNNNKIKSDLNGLIRAGIAHLWFVTLHPFDDGNGRLTRAITDMALAQSENNSRRMIAVSSSILENRSSYYDILEKTQSGTMDITAWLVWFLSQLGVAIGKAELGMQTVLFKAQYWKKYNHITITDRQRKALNKLLDAGPGGFEGGMTTRKYASINSVSKPTATRELTDLLDKGMLTTGPGKGRSANYILASHHIT